MPLNNWRPVVQVISDGELVDATVTNRPLAQLADRTQHLKEQISNLGPSTGNVIYAGATCDPSVGAHDFVFFDAADGIYRPALAEAAFDGIEYKATPRSFAAGWVMQKASATIADILVIGRINLDTLGVDPSEMIDDPMNDPFQPGRYYLSSRVPGKMTRFEKAPLIQLGFFSETESMVMPIQRDLYDSHKHYSFDLVARPSASQNYNRTGWTNFGDTDPDTGKRYVDYYNKGSAGTPPNMLLCIRGNSEEAIPVDAPIRIELFRDETNGSALTAEIFEDLDPNDPTSGTTAGTSVITWPVYGQWFAIPGTNLECSFINKVGYTDTLENDFSGLNHTKRYLVLLPNDFTGWTNANPFDVLSTPSGVLYRYIVEGQSDLFGVFPPSPPNSSDLAENGTSLRQNEDYIVNDFGIFWINGRMDPTYTYSPWPNDFTADTDVDLDPNLGKQLRFDFIKSGLSSGSSVVQSIRGQAPIKVTVCPTGLPGTSGNLQIGIDLSLLVTNDEPINAPTALSTIDGVSFGRAYVVSEIVAGTGLAVERLTAGTTKNVGKVRLSVTSAKFEGEFDSIGLCNAKQERNDYVSWIEFPPLDQAASGIIASAKVPNLDWDPSGANFKMQVRGRWFGTTSVSSTGIVQQAVFKAVYHVVRASAAFNIAALSEENAALVQYWIVPFNPSYAANTMLAAEIPYDATDTDLFELNSTTLSVDSLVYANGGFLVGDVVTVRIDRVANDGSGNVDSYPGRVALPSLRWMLL